MVGRRGTLQPLDREEQKSETLFAPSRTPIESVPPSNSFSVDDTIEVTDRVNERQLGRAESSAESSFSSASFSTGSSTPSDSSSTSVATPNQDSTHKSMIYSLQDENADLRKEIQSLEIVLRDHGFAKNGKQIISSDEIVVTADDQDQEGNIRAHMEMVSMMGMDPERPTVLTRYMEYKISELETDLDKMEYERDRFATMVKNLTSEASAKESAKAERLKETKSQKRKLEEKLTNAMKLSKTREGMLAEKVDDLETDLDASYRKEEKLLERIALLESALEQMVRGDSSAGRVPELEAQIEALTKREQDLKEQITALETNLEYTIEESTKREKQLTGKINALETNLEWNIDNSSRREDLLRDKIAELEVSNKTGGSNDNSMQKEAIPEENHDDDESVTDRDHDTLTLDQSDVVNGDQDTLTLEPFDGDMLALEKSLTQEDFVADFADQLKKPPIDPFQQSISEISKYHNERLEEWKREESKEREEQLKKRIAALETNLEWNMNESKKQEKLFDEQIAALKTNLEWNIEESTKREAVLQKRIEQLEGRREEDSLTLDSLIPPDDVLEMKKQLERLKQQKEKLEEWLSKVVQESTKREKNLQIIISELEETNKASLEREDVLRTRVASLEEQAQGLQTETSKNDDLQNLYESALHKEFEKQDAMAQEISDLKKTLKTNDEDHRVQQEELLSKMGELAGALEENENGSVGGATHDEFEKEKQQYLSCIAVLEEEIAELRGTLQRNNQVHEEQQGDLLTRVNELFSALEKERRKNRSKATTNDSSAGLQNIKGDDKQKDILVKSVESLKAELKNAMRQNEASATRIFELENELSSNRNEKFAQNKKITKLQKDMDEITQKNEELLETIMELEMDLQDEQQEKLDASERVTKLEGTVENLNLQQAPIAAINDRLEKEAEDFRKNEAMVHLRVSELQNEIELYRTEKLDRNKKVANLQSRMEEIATKNEELVETVMELESDLEYERKEKFERIKLIAMLQSELEFLQDNTEIDEVTDAIEDESIRSMRSVRSRRIFEVENELASYRKGKFAQNKKIVKLQTDMQEIAQKNEGLVETIMQLESDLEYEQQEKNERNKRIAALQSELDNVSLQKVPIDPSSEHSIKEAEMNEAERNELIERLSSLQADFDKTSTRYKSLKSHHKDLIIEHEALKAERERLNNRIDLLMGDGPESSPKTFKKTPESSLKSFLQAELKTSKAEQERLRKYAEDLQNELNETKSKSKLEQEHLHERLEELTAKLEDSASNSEKDRLEQRIEELTKELDKSRSNANMEEERLQRSIEKLTTKLQDLTSNSNFEKDLLVQRIEELTKELQDAKDLQESVASENGPEPERTAAVVRNKPLAKLRNKVVITELKNELVNRERIVELEDLKKEFVESSISHKTREEELSARVAALETELEFGQHEHERLERVIFVIRNELRMAAENIEPTIARNRELEELLEAKNSQHKRSIENRSEEDIHSNSTEQQRLIKQVDDLKAELESSSKAFNNNILDLKMKLKSKQSEFEHLNEFKHELEAELEEMTKKVQNIEKEFLSAAQTMDTTYGDLSCRNTAIEKELVSYKTENKYLDKFITELQNELTEKLNIKRETPPSVQRIRELRNKKSPKKKTPETSDDEDLIESERSNHTDDEMIGSERQTHDKLPNNDQSDDELQISGKSKDEIENSSSSSSKGSRKEERERLTAEILEIEGKLKAEKTKRDSLNSKVSEMEEERAQMKLDKKPTKIFTFKIREMEADIEVMNAYIYELEADLEDLVDDLEDHDRTHSENDERTSVLDRSGTSVLDRSGTSVLDRSGTSYDTYDSVNNRDRLSKRVVELEKDLEELEDELEETIERGKSQRQKLVGHNDELEKKLEKTKEKAAKDKHALNYRINALEKELEETIEKYRKDQQALAIHYIEKEREVKDTSKKADIRERRLKSQISQLEEEIKSVREGGEKKQFLTSSIAVLVEDIENIDISNNATDDERLVAKVTKLKKQYDGQVHENKVLNEVIIEMDGKLQDANAIIESTEKELNDHDIKYIELETKWKNSNEEHETAIWEAEQKMRDLIDTASLERKEKKRYQDESKYAREELDVSKEENEKLSSENSNLEAQINVQKEKCETFKQEIADLEAEMRTATTNHDAELERIAREEDEKLEALNDRIAKLKEEIQISTKEHEIERDRILSRVQNLQKQIEVSEEEKENLQESIALQVQSFEEEKKKHAILSDRFAALEKELEFTIEKSKNDQKLHLDVKKRMVDITMRNQAERANLDNRLFKLNKELETCRKKNESLSYELKLLEEDKNQANTSAILGDDLRSTFAENDSLFEKIQSYEGDSGKGSEIDSATRSAARELISAPLLVEGDEDGGVAHRKRIEDGIQNRKKISDYLSPLIEKADSALGQEIPFSVVKGVEAKLFLRADDVSNGNLKWEDFESILEEVCQDFDQDAWFDLQEAFFVAWEEIELEKIEQEYDGVSNQ